MQEASVSSTTSSPHKLVTLTIGKPDKDINTKTNSNSKDIQENVEEACSNQVPLTESRGSHHSRRRTHTCSKAGRRGSKSSDQRSSRKSHNRRRHHRSRRSRSRSRHYSGSRRQHRRRHRRRYSTDYSSSSSSYRSSSDSRSPSHHSAHRRHRSDSSQPIDLLNPRSEHDSGDTNPKMSPQHSRPLTQDFSQAMTSELPKDNTSIVNGLPKLTAANPALNGLVSLLLNTTSSNTSLTDLFGPAIYAMTGNSINTAASIPASNSTRQARRLYIGSIPLGITSETMVAFFNAELHARGLCQSIGEPVVCAQVNSERHFAFIELRSVEETTAALSLDGINCLGSTLRIRRPRDYFPPGTNSSAQSVGHLNANAIFLTGIPTNLAEQDLLRLLSAYGALRSFSVLRDPVTAMSRGCGFFEYTASESADLACLGLQNHPAGGGKFFAIRADHLLATPISTPLPSLPSLTTQTSATPILCLANMVSPRDIDSPEEYADVMEDVRSECLLHGSVLSIHIPQPSKSSSSAASSNSSSISASNCANLGKIFVEFATAQQAQAASLALEGRKYNGRTVSTSFCDPARYAAGEFG